MLHFWIKAFGISTFSVRILSCVFSSIAIFFIFKIGEKFFNLRIAFIASVIFTFSNYHMYFAHEARVYSLFMLLSTVSMFAFLTLLEQPKNKKYIAVLIVSNILLVYAHFLGFFILLVQFLSLLTIVELRRKFLKQYLIFTVIVLVFYLPYMSILLERFLITASEGTWIPPVGNLGPLHDVLYFLTNKSEVNYIIFLMILWMVTYYFIENNFTRKYLRFSLIGASILYLFYSILIREPWELNPRIIAQYWNMSSNIFVMTSYFFFIIMMLVLALISQKVSATFKILLIWFFAPLLIIFISSIWMPMFLDRYLIFITPSFFLLIAIGVSNLENRTSIKFTWLIVAIMAITFKLNVENNREVGELASKVKEIKSSRTIVYICPDYFGLNFTSLTWIMVVLF